MQSTWTAGRVTRGQNKQVPAIERVTRWLESARFRSLIESCVVTLRYGLRMERFVSLFGYAVLLVLAWLMSPYKRVIPWRVVLSGTVLQFVLALCILKTSTGYRIFSFLGDVFTSLLDFSDAGSQFVFGEKFQDF